MAKGGGLGAKRVSFIYMQVAAIVALLCIPVAVVFETKSLPFPAGAIMGFLGLVVGIFTPIYMNLAIETHHKHKNCHLTGIDTEHENR